MNTSANYYFDKCLFAFSSYQYDFSKIIQNFLSKTLDTPQSAENTFIPYTPIRITHSLSHAYALLHN